MDLCQNCGQKIEKNEECPYCKNHFCSKCYTTHMNWEKQHEDWNLYNVTPAGGITSNLPSGPKSYGPVYQTEGERRKYRRSRTR